jgi:hypothetical protein
MKVHIAYHAILDEIALFDHVKLQKVSGKVNGCVLNVIEF